MQKSGKKIKIQEKKVKIVKKNTKNHNLAHESTDNMVSHYQPSPCCIKGIWFRESSLPSIYNRQRA